MTDEFNVHARRVGAGQSLIALLALILVSSCTTTDGSESYRLGGQSPDVTATDRRQVLEQKIGTTERALCAHLRDDVCTGVKSHLSKPGMPNDRAPNGLSRWMEENVCGPTSSELPPWPTFCSDAAAREMGALRWNEVVDGVDPGRILIHVCQLRYFVRDGREASAPMNNECEKNLRMLSDLYAEQREFDRTR
jgi:hypothetical protein